jgi:hypothetical protein
MDFSSNLSSIALIAEDDTSAAAGADRDRRGLCGIQVS